MPMFLSVPQDPPALPSRMDPVGLYLSWQVRSVKRRDGGPVCVMPHAPFRPVAAECHGAMA